ncbi:aldose epimerase family protein [Streptococcus sp. DD12]|uniref:aldose epimerase family protein n=1 Tax=Streptococcus sp. DD12 TaxID=1777880 RepID=UPI00079765F2|nr:aldose epimerase family protein [Streptococcus sp. DD12]KXT75411.1 Aldose 1-epimerase [Streptococcus sp. DD12]
MKINSEVIGEVDSRDVSKITMTNANGLVISTLTLGATLQAFLLPTDRGDLKNIVLGFDNYEDYNQNSLRACQSVGRVAGRIGGASYTYKGVRYNLPKNEGENCLHGGPKGMQVQNWDYTTHVDDDYVETRFVKKLYSHVDGFPGDLSVSIIYRLDNANRLTIRFEAFDVTETTVFNPTNHVYLNLSDKQDLSTHTLQIHSDQYLALASDLIPTGDKITVDQSYYDFRNATDLLPRIEANNGFDDAFVVADEKSDQLKAIATLQDKESGDGITLFSNRNGLVIYTMDIIEGNISFARDKGQQAKGREALAMEAQTLPDAVNHKGFGNIILEKGQQATYEIGFQYFNAKTLSK